MSTQTPLTVGRGNLEHGNSKGSCDPKPEPLSYHEYDEAHCDIGEMALSLCADLADGKLGLVEAMKTARNINGEMADLAKQHPDYPLI